MEELPSGANEATISTLNTITYAKPVEEEGPVKCDVCLEEFTEGSH